MNFGGITASERWGAVGEKGNRMLGISVEICSISEEKFAPFSGQKISGISTRNAEMSVRALMNAKTGKENVPSTKSGGVYEI